MVLREQRLIHPMHNASLLEGDRLSKSFGAVAALKDVSFSLAAGEIRALCGENGAGKSTLVKLLMGVHQPDSGHILIDGAPQVLRTPQTAQQLGLAMVAQELSIAPHLSVLDNVWLGNRQVPLMHRRPALRAKAKAALEQLGAAHLDLDRPAGTLTIGERQIVEIARLIARDARLLILDEPTASLSDVEIERIFHALRQVKASGRTALYVTHRLGEIFEICDSVTVLRNGEHIATRPAGGLSRSSLIELMLGRPIEDMYPPADDHPAYDAALAVQDMTVPGITERISFTAPRGKILCLAGQVGSGAQAVPRALAGLVPDATGRVHVNGAELRLGSVRRSLKQGMIFISEDRSSEGVFLGRRVLENLVTLRLADHRRLGFLSWPRLRATAARLAEKSGIERMRLSARAADLSGGNQQKLLFGRGLDFTNKGILLMNDPTRGVDVGSRAEIYRLMRAFCELGFAVVMSSADLEEVIGIADVALTMFRGRIIARYERDQIAMRRILADITHPAAIGEAAA
jgi:ABC-type sugar transport system ATPase subunit